MLANIKVPTLLLDPRKCERNIARMSQKSTDNQVAIRPHFKTHQSQKVGRLFRKYGVDKIAVSSLRMAEYFAADGWTDITVAFPVNILEIDRINSLAGQIHLNLLTEHPTTIAFLHEKLQHTVGIFIEINTGNNRSGKTWADRALIDDMLDRIQASPRLEFRGFLGHAGHSYAARSEAAILEVHDRSRAIMQAFRDQYEDRFPDLIISLGDTPTCSVAQEFSGIDEIRPGNYVYYDVTQSLIGSCTVEDIAVALASPVVALAPERNEIIVYGGGIHLSKDRVQGAEGFTIFGLVGEWTDKGWSVLTEPDTYVRSLSQEHGVIHTTPERVAATRIGDLIPILPVHSCMCADLMKEVYTLEGEKMEMLSYLEPA